MSAATVRLAVTDDDRAAAFAVRHDVFVTEQGVPADLELDEHDDTAEHVVAYDEPYEPNEPYEPYEGRTALGAGRLVTEPPGFAGTDPVLGPVGHLGRLAVRPEGRGTGLGVALVRAIEARATDLGLRVMVLGAQTQAIGFYERLGYTAYGDVFDDAGLPHRWMRRLLRTGATERQD